MFSTRLYVRILSYVILIVLAATSGFAGIISGRAVILGTVALCTAAWLIGALVHYLNAYNRKIRLFLDSIADNESTLYFPEHATNREQCHLHASFNRIYTLMTACKKKEFERELYQKEYESWKKLMRVLTHEIMNSITPVVSLSDTLLSYFQADNVRKSAKDMTDATIGKTIRGLETIKSQGQNLMYLTESYRQFACLKQPEARFFSLTDLIQDIQTLYQEEMQLRHIGFSVCCLPPEIQIHADEKMLSQVLINLIKNAMQALDEQTDRRIRIRVETQEKQLYITVTDNGPGIPSNLAEDIFIPFFTTKTTGTGIGLSLSRQIIRMHGGELSVTSQPYCETSFLISLPIDTRRPGR